MIEMSFYPNPKQYKALELLNNNDKETEILWYGWAAWGGKTVLAAAWITWQCNTYHWVRYWVFRRFLQDAKDSTFVSFVREVNNFWFIEWIHYKIRDWKDIIFANGSEILFRWLQEKPTDIHFTKLWSLELTWAFVDESNECPVDWIETLQVRVWRWKNIEYKIPEKILCCFNPDKWWVYSWFWKPYKDKLKTSKVKFIRALPVDNAKNLSAQYLRKMKSLKWIKRKRLWEWNFDYDDTPWRLFWYDKICDLKTNPAYTWDKYISADIAWEWKDKTIIFVWDWFKLVYYKVIKENKIDDNFDNKFRELAKIYWIWMSSVIVDKTWLGEWVVGHLWCKWFVSNATVIQSEEYKQDKTQKENYSKLKDQCYFKLAELVQNNKIDLSIMSDSDFEILKEELDVITHINIWKDEPKKVIAKDKIKEVLGRSPDFADALMMRMFFEFKEEIRGSCILL